MCRRRGVMVGALAAIALLTVSSVAAMPPAQRLPSAILVYPLIVVEGGGAVTDTRVELVNLSGREVRVHCFYVRSSTCGASNFFVTLTPNQPLSWLVSKGSFNIGSFSAVPPFSGTGELKCVVLPSGPELAAYNVIQGRATVFDADDQTIGYGAVGFQRLTPGEFSNVLSLDGATYARCPDELHFVILASDPGEPASASEIVLTTCSEDLQNLLPTSTVVQFLVINEFEQFLSTSVSVTCSDRQRLDQISSVFSRPTLGTDTGHLIVRGVQNPVLALVIDRFLASDDVIPVPGTAGNEPALRGGRAATIRLP